MNIKSELTTNVLSPCSLCSSINGYIQDSPGWTFNQNINTNYSGTLNIHGLIRQSKRNQYFLHNLQYLLPLLSIVLSKATFLFLLSFFSVLLYVVRFLFVCLLSYFTSCFLTLPCLFLFFFYLETFVFLLWSLWKPWISLFVVLNIYISLYPPHLVVALNGTSCFARFCNSLFLPFQNVFTKLFSFSK